MRGGDDVKVKNTNDKNKKLDTTQIIVTIIQVIGAIIVAIITKL